MLWSLPQQAIEDSKIDLQSIDNYRAGVIWGSGIGGIETFQNEVLGFASGNGTPRFNPFFIPKMIGDIAPGHISMKYRFMGPSYTTVSACASSANAMVDALNYIRLGHCDIIKSQEVVKLLLPLLEWAALMPCMHYQLETMIQNCIQAI